jgi:flagellar motor switch protein FliM
MTDKILSQEEVDALLKGVESGEIETESAPQKEIEGVRPYDFTSQEKIIRGRMPGLEMANEAFARLFRTSLSNLLMKFIDVSTQGLEIIKFGDFIKTIPVPSSINIFKMNPLKGCALLVVEAPLVFAFVEFFFGGAGIENVKSEGRAFTQIEGRVIQRIVKIALKDMQESWKGITLMEPELIGMEINPQFVTIVTPAEIVIKIDILVEIENFSGKMFFCIPYSTVEQIKEKLYSGIHGDKLEADQRWTRLLRELIRETYVEISVELAKVNMTFQDVMNFEKGNIINLGKSIDDELVIKVEGVPKFWGTPGISRGNQAVKITRLYE